MARSRQGLRFLGACLLQLAALTSASPIQANANANAGNAALAVDKRDEIIVSTTTVWIPPATVTVNPNDPTITREAGWTSTAAPPAFTSTVTSSCITYNYSYPPDKWTTTTTTITATAQSTVTVTNLTRAPQTQYFFHTPTITVTTPTATYVSYHCLNTLVVQYADWEYLTWTWSNWEHIATTTGLCLTTSTRSTTIPGVTGLPTSTKSLEDWEYFSEPGVSVETKNTVAIATDVTSIIPGTSTYTSCKGNPSPETTTTITVTQRKTVTDTITRTEKCAVGVEQRQSGDHGEGEGSQVYPPVSSYTTVYTTVTVIDNVVSTLTGTAVVDIDTQLFPVTRIAYVTKPATGTVTVTATTTVCAKA
ncbi:uncharacterized protein C8A04DRAFT_16002 [Dichotomopilus funicola]|uniref:Uncharacterized protein n=1 Tax=Dichotomopilus funicola TaxID=1934379 RepID=A0AAN6UUJ2_9PEZI|nr:hypothetical protein C8A04DRAFT_16002 [Dichotomopilus funicola]